MKPQRQYRTAQGINYKRLSIYICMAESYNVQVTFSSVSRLYGLFGSVMVRRSQGRVMGGLIPSVSHVRWLFHPSVIDFDLIISSPYVVASQRCDPR